MNLLIALVIGLMAGAHSATWGMYKDAIYEGFTYRKYFRSIIFSGLIAIVFERVTNLELAQPANMVILYGMTYVIERGVLEFYKTFLREEDQSKYFIPMQFHVGGKGCAQPVAAMVGWWGLPSRCCPSYSGNHCLGGRKIETPERRRGSVDWQCGRVDFSLWRRLERRSIGRF